MPLPSLTLLRTQSDERLVALAREGHERAFEAIVERYRRPLLRAARRVLPEARAEDALQQGLMSAWAALGRGDEVRELRPWLFRIIHNCSLNALRVSGYDYDELQDTLRITDASGDELERRAVVRLTLASVAALPERQRDALLATAVGGYTHEQIAREFGMSDNALRQLVYRARSSVRAAATAVTPMPLVHWFLTAGSDSSPFAQRIAELTAGAAPAGAAAAFAKVGTVAVLATTALTGPGLVERVAHHPHSDSVAVAAAQPARPILAANAGGSTPQHLPAAVRRAATRPGPGAGGPKQRSGGTAGGHGRRSGSGGSGSGEDRAPEHRGEDGSGRSGGSRHGDDGGGGTGDGSPSSGSDGGDDHSGSSGSGSGSSGSVSSGGDDGGSSASGSSGSGSVSGSTSSGSDSHSGPGGGDSAPVAVATPDPIVTTVPTVTPETESHSGSGRALQDSRDGSSGPG